MTIQGSVLISIPFQVVKTIGGPMGPGGPNNGGPMNNGGMSPYGPGGPGSSPMTNMGPSNGPGSNNMGMMNFIFAEKMVQTLTQMIPLWSYTKS